MKNTSSKNYIYGQSPLNDAVEFSAKHTELARILVRNAISSTVFAVTSYF